MQVDPGFAYAYTLLGHEFALTEELDRALACFRNAIRVNNRHYNAWYLYLYHSTASLSLYNRHYNTLCLSLACLTLIMSITSMSPPYHVCHYHV